MANYLAPYNLFYKMGMSPNIEGTELELNKLIHDGLISVDGKFFVSLIIIFSTTVAVSLDVVPWKVFCRWFELVWSSGLS